MWASIAVLSADAAAGTVTAQIKQATTGTLIQTFVFDQGYAPLDLAVIPDQSANGAPELALLGRHAANGSVQVEVRDTRSGARLTAVAFNPAFAPQRLAVLPDRNGNGAAELAVLSRDAGGQLKTELRDAVTGALVRNLWFDHLAPLDLAVLPDRNGNGCPEVAVPGVPAVGGAQVLIKDTATQAEVSRLDF